LIFIQYHLGAGSTLALLMAPAAGKAGAARDNGSSSAMAGTNAGVASDDGVEPFTASRKRFEKCAAPADQQAALMA
jgi:hypothetical protein